jgi:hypothetical protein
MSAKSDEEPVHEIIYDNRIESYKTFFNHQSMRDFEPVVRGTVLDEPYFALCVSWRAAANSHVLPWVMMESLQGLWNTFGKDQTFSARLVAALAQQLPQRVNVRKAAQKQLADAIREIAGMVEMASQSPETNWDVQATWLAYLNVSKELPFALWGTERQCYGSIYYAYEHFICAVMTKLNGTPYKLTKFHKLVDDARLVLPNDVVKDCIGNPVVEAARRVRNALCHNGGKINKELSGIKHGVSIHNGTLHVMPDDNQKLLTELETRVVRLTNAALAILNRSAVTAVASAANTLPAPSVVG